MRHACRASNRRTSMRRTKNRIRPHTPNDKWQNQIYSHISTQTPHIRFHVTFTFGSGYHFCTHVIFIILSLRLWLYSVASRFMDANVAAGVEKPKRFSAVDSMKAWKRRSLWMRLLYCTVSILWWSLFNAMRPHWMKRMKRSHIESQSEMKSAPQWLETLWIWSRRAIPFCDLG